MADLLHEVKAMAYSIKMRIDQRMNGWTGKQMHTANAHMPRHESSLAY